MNMKEIRSLFPGAEAQIYFDVGVRGLLSTPVREAVDRYLEARMMGTGDKAELIGFAEGARESFAALEAGGVSGERVATLKKAYCV